MSRPYKLHFREGPLDGVSMTLEGHLPEIMIFGDIHDPGDVVPLTAYTIELRGMNCKDAGESTHVNYHYSGGRLNEDVADWLWPKKGC